MSTRGIYVQELARGEAETVFLRWGSPHESSNNLSDYGNYATSRALVDIGMVENLVTMAIPSRDFFENHDRIWLPSFHCRQEDYPYVELHVYPQSDRESLSEFLDNYDREAPRMDYAGIMLEFSHCVSPYHLLFTEFLYAKEPHIPYHIFDSLDETLNSADEYHDSPEFAYVYSANNTDWRCISLLDYEGAYREEKTWNQNYHTQANYDGFVEDILKFYEDEIVYYSNDFASAFNIACETLEELSPGISDKTGVYEISNKLFSE